MPLLVSFTAGNYLHSHIFEQLEAPGTKQAVLDLQARAAEEYSFSNVIIGGWDVLPGHMSFPARLGGRYDYFVTYRLGKPNDTGHGTSHLSSDMLITSTLALRSVEEGLRSEGRYSWLRLVSCKALFGSTPVPWTPYKKHEAAV